MYLDIHPLITYIICKYLLPFSRFSFCFVDGFLLSRHKSFKLKYFPFVFTFAFVCFEPDPKNIGGVLLGSAPTEKLRKANWVDDSVSVQNVMSSYVTYF